MDPLSVFAVFLFKMIGFIDPLKAFAASLDSFNFKSISYTLLDTLWESIGMNFGTDWTAFFDLAAGKESLPCSKDYALVTGITTSPLFID